MDKLFEGVLRSEYPEPMKRQLLERLVNDGAFKANISESDLKAIFSLAFSYILSYESSHFRRSIGAMILIAFSSGQALFLDRYLGHETIMDLFHRAALPASSSSSATVLSSHRIRLSNPNDNCNGNNSAGSSVVASPMSISGPPTPSTGPASPTGSTSSLIAAGSTTIGNSDNSNYKNNNNSGEDSLLGDPASASSAAELHSRLYEEDAGASGGTPAKSTGNHKNEITASSSSLRDDADDGAISASISRQKGICKSAVAISPTALLDALAICLESLSARIGEGGMIRRHKVIAALVGKLLQAHRTSMDVAFSLVNFLKANSDCMPIGESAEVLCKSFVQCLAPARPRRSPGSSSEKVVFDLDTFMRQVSVISKFLPRLWSGANAETSTTDANFEGTPRGALVSLQTTFEILLSPKPISNGLPRSTARGEPFMPLVGVLNQISADVRERTAKELARNRDISDAQLATMLGRMCCWILLLPIWNFTPAIVDWVGAIVKQMAAEWRFTPLITTCEAESANLWKVAMLPNKRIIVRESALKILAELMLAYQHDPKVYFDQISYDIIASLPDLVSDPNSAPLLTPISNLVLGLLRIHGLPPSFTLNRHIYTTLNDLPRVDVMELERYIHRVQWNSKRLPRGWVGLHNLGNTCFANSVIQALRACSEFTRDVLALVPSTSVITVSHLSSVSNSNNTTNQILSKFQFLLARLVFSQRPVLKPEEFLLISRPPWFVWKAQQDCNEYLKYFMDNLHETEKSAQQLRQQLPENGPLPQHQTVDLSSTTVLRNFGGKIESSYTCHDCENVSMKEEIFTDLPLPFVDVEQQQQQKLSEQKQRDKEKNSLQPPSKVLCSEENGVKVAQKSSSPSGNNPSATKDNDLYFDCPESPPTKELAGIGVGGGDDVNDGAADHGDGRTSRLGNTAPKGYQPATPAPSRSPSPALRPVNTFANDAIMEEEEEEDEEDGRNNIRPPIATDVSTATSDVPMVASDVTTVDADSTAGLAEIGLSELNAVSAKLQQFQSEGSQRQDKWDTEETASAITTDEPQPTVLPAVLAAALPPPPPPPPPLTSNAAPPFSSTPFILQDLLDAYFTPETLEGANAYRCERCDGLRTATQTTVLKESPEYLILTLMRFKYDIQEKRRKKINDPVVIPEMLTVPLNGGAEASKELSAASVSQSSSFCSASSQFAPASNIVPSSASTDTLTADHSSFVPFSSVSYRLLAIVIHQGESPDAGHYFTYVRTHPESNAVMGPASTGWIQFNDAFAKEVDAGVMEKVLNTNLVQTSSFRSSETPYVLFYEKMQGLDSSPGTKREGDLGPLIKGIAPTLLETNRNLISADNRRWLKTAEDNKTGGNAAASSTNAVDKTVGKPPDDDDKKGGGGGPCGGQGFGSLGNGPRFVF